MEIVIIGGGPAGIFAALNVKNKKNNVTILERNDRIGKKLLATGNGRCNYTNLVVSSKNYNHPEFVEDLINEFKNTDLIDYFSLMGLMSTTDGNRVYPVTLKASSLLNVLIRELNKKEINVITNEKVIDIDKNFNIITENNKYKADKIIFATGGMSMPSSGSDGFSFNLLKKLGHKITDFRPALTQLKLDSKYLKHLSGVKVIGEVSLFKKDKLIDKRNGDLLFTNYGISGPPILDISVEIENFNEYYIEMPIVNNIKKDFIEKFYSSFYILSDYSLEEFLIGIVDKKFIHYITDTLRIDKNMILSSLENKDIENILKLLTKSRFKILGTNGFKNSQVTRGGVNLLDVNKNDFSSKVKKDIYIIGEALDIDGECGGYNLYFAFLSGYIVGKRLR